MLLNQMIARNADFGGDRIATVDGDRVRTWREFRDRIARLAAALAARGIVGGDRIGIFAVNSDRYLEVQFAAWWLGAVIVPLNTRWTVAENVDAASDVGLKIIFSDGQFLDDCRKLAGAVPALTIIGLGLPADTALTDHGNLICEHPPVPPAVLAHDALAGIYYTGGTTGRSKGVMLSHRALWCSALSYLPVLDMTDGSRYLHAAPMFHLADSAFSLCATMAGIAHYFVPAFRSSEVLSRVDIDGITHTVMVPTMVDFMLSDPGFPQARLGTLRCLVYGGSAMSEALQERATHLLPHVRLLHVYGQTEMAASLACLDPSFHKSGDPRRCSVGRPAPTVELRIVRADGGDAEVGEPGEILARGPVQMDGYWQRPEENLQVFEDGWVRTGDIAYKDSDGFLFLCDRAKDMIISGGENVFSVEVERVISLHPAVATCAVIGVPDAIYGERVHAVVVLKPGGCLQTQQLYEHCRAMIAGYKCPRSLELRNELPLSPVGKVRKQELRAEHRPVPAAMMRQNKTGEKV